MSGLGSFVTNLVGGVDTRQRWEDRKRQRKLDEEDRAYLQEERAQGREDRVYTLEERSRKRKREDKAQAEEDRLLQEAADERKANADAYAAASAPDEAAPTSRSLDSGLDTGATGALPLTFGAGTPALPDPTLAAAQPQLPPPVQPAMPPAMQGQYGRVLPPQDPLADMAGRVSPPSQVQPGMMGRGQIDPNPGNLGRGQPLVTQPGPSAEEWNKMTPAQRDAFQPLRAAPHQFDPTLDMVPDLSNMKGRVSPPSRELPAMEGRVSPPSQVQPGMMGRVSPPSEAPTAAGKSAMAGLSADFKTATQAPTPTPGDTSGSVAQVLPTPGATPAQAAQASDPAQAAANPAASPAVQIAAATAPSTGRLAFGMDAPLKVTPAQAKQAQDNFLQNYLDKGAPKMVEYYLKTGQVDKAQAFMTWTADKQNQQSMKLWAEGVHAAAIGDETKMLDAFGAYYNRFDNGEELVRGKSAITRDGAGNMTGAVLTFKDTATGVEHSQTFHGTEDLLQAGILALSPEKMFEMMQGQVTAAQGVKADTIKMEQEMALAIVRESRAAGVKTTPQRVAAIWAQLSKDSFGQFDKLPLEERRRQVIEILSGQDQTSSSYDGGGDLPDDYSDPTE